jgi:O-methyltransferase
MNERLDLIRKTARTVLPEGVRQRLRHVAQPPAPDLMASACAASLVTPLNLHLLQELVQRLGRLRIDGDIVECGVYRCGSAAVLGSAMLALGDEPPRKLWLFDSFAGMPPASDRDGEFSHTLEGTYVGSEQETRGLLEQAGVPPSRFEIVTGFYADTFPAVETPRTALLHVDCDFYEPVKLTLEKFYPRLSPGGFVVLNDYGIYKGARTATDEFFEVNGLDIQPVAIDPTASFFQKPGDCYSGLPVAGHFPGYPGAVA